MKQHLLVILLSFAVFGCATQPPQTAPAVNLSGYPPEFKQGYTDGCSSARPNAARARNDERYKSDVNYAQGWRDGYDICRRRQ